MRWTEILMLLALPVWAGKFDVTVAEQDLPLYDTREYHKILDTAFEDNFQPWSQSGFDHTVYDKFEDWVKANFPKTTWIRVDIKRNTAHYKEITSSELVPPEMRLPAFKQYIERMLSKHKASDVTFFFHTVPDIWADVPPAEEIKFFLERVPTLRCDKDPSSAEMGGPSILIPDFYIHGDEYECQRKITLEVGRQIPFSQRAGKIFWRGSLTGGGIYSGSRVVRKDDLPTLPRAQLLFLSKMYPGKIDADLISHSSLQFFESGLAHLFRELLGPKPSPSLPYREFARYKYLISTDGYVSAWGRVPSILHTGSCLLLQHRYSQFFYPALIPFVHYYPLEDDLSNLLAAHAFLERNPAFAERVGENGRRFAEDFLTTDYFDNYLHKVLHKISQMTARSVAEEEADS